MLSLLMVGASLACGRQAGAPEEFPPVTFGMTQSEVRILLTELGGSVIEDDEGVLVISGRDRRVADETFLFYRDRLAAWTVRFGEEATRGGFQRLARRFTLAYGESVAESDDGMILRAEWRIVETGGRLHLSGYVGGRGDASPLMARVEDPTVMPRLIRKIRENDLDQASDSEE
jgi:hypothetical protein